MQAAKKDEKEKLISNAAEGSILYQIYEEFLKSKWDVPTRHSTS